MPIRGEATAVLSSGKKLTLVVNFATMARAAPQVGLPADALFKVLADKDDPRQMLALLAMLEQALRRNHPEFDEEMLGDLMLTDGDALGTALMEAVQGAFGDGEDGDSPNPPKRGPSTASKPRGRKRA